MTASVVLNTHTHVQTAAVWSNQAGTKLQRFVNIWSFIVRRPTGDQSMKIALHASLLLGVKLGGAWDNDCKWLSIGQRVSDSTPLHTSHLLQRRTFEALMTAWCTAPIQVSHCILLHNITLTLRGIPYTTHTYNSVTNTSNASQCPHSHNAVYTQTLSHWTHTTDDKQTLSHTTVDTRIRSYGH